MRQLIHASLAVVVGILFSHMPTALAQSRAGGAPSSGVYTTYLNDQPFGTETYTVTRDADASQRSVADISFSGVQMKATAVFVRNRPVSFMMEMGGSRTLTEEFTATGVKVMAQGKPAQEVKAQPAVLLENGAWHYFLFMFAQYDATLGGQQKFSAFLPSQALEFGVSVERLGSPSFDVKGEKVVTEHYRVGTTLGLSFEIWTDPARVPLVISIPAQRIKAVRQGAESLAAAILPPAAPKPTPSANDPFTSEEVTFHNGEEKLAGTLTIPKSGGSPHPAVVLISGSGAQDRDGSTLLNFYRLIAERLSANGIAVLRADDRGAGQSSMPTKPSSYRDLVNDSRAAVELLLARREIDPKRIALIGHSEGAETALTMAAEDPRIAAIMLLAGSSRPIDRVLLEQSLYAIALDAPVNASDRTKFNAVARQLIKVFDDARAQPKPADPTTDSLGWFREHLGNDPLAQARKVRAPVLVLNGERDDNVLPYHALELAQAFAASGNNQVTLRIFPNLTHLFTPSRRDPSVTDSQAGEISPEFLQTLQSWATNTLVKAGAK